MLETHVHVSALGTYAMHLSTEKCWPSTGNPCVSALNHPETHTVTQKINMSQPVCMVSAECQPDSEWNLIFMYRLWLKLSSRARCPLQYDIHTCQQRCILLPLTLSQYPKGYTPPLLSNPTSLFHLGPTRTPWRRTAATISAHVNMQHLHTHHCGSPLKIAQLPRCTCWGRSFLKSASALLMDNHGTLHRGEHEPDFESKTITIREQQRNTGNGALSRTNTMWARNLLLH